MHARRLSRGYSFAASTIANGVGSTVRSRRVVGADALLGERAAGFIDRSGSADHVLELRAVHATLRQICQRVRGSSAPANGETWRSIVMRSESSPSSAATSPGEAARSSCQAST